MALYFIESLFCRSSESLSSASKIIKSKGKPEDTDRWNAYEASFISFQIHNIIVLLSLLERKLKLSNIPSWILPVPRFKGSYGPFLDSKRCSFAYPGKSLDFHVKL